MTALRMRERKLGDGVVLGVSGDAGLPGCVEFEQALERLAAGTARVVVVDLRMVTFLGSSAMNSLLLLRQRLGGRGAALRLVMQESQVWMAMRAARLTGLFEIYPSVRDALAGPMPTQHAG